MNNPFFTIMIPTRKRINHLKLCLESIFSTVSNPNNIEIRLAIDEDDTYTKRQIKSIISSYKNIFIHERNRGVSQADDYFNWMALRFCKGKYLIGGTDDGLMRTKDWDINSYERLENFLKDKPDGIVCGILDDGEQKIQKCTWFTCDYPVISKVATNVLGFYFDWHFPRYGSDLDITKTYNAINRIVDLRDIFVYEREPLEMRLVQETGEALIPDIPLPGDLHYKAFAGKFLDDNVQKLNDYIQSVKK